MKEQLAALITVLLLLCLFSPALAGQSPALHVDGNLLKTDKGAAVRLQGVNVAGMEWSNNGEGRTLQSVRIAIEDWHANAIRLPLAQDRWFGFAQGQTDGGASYRALVDSVVNYASGKGCYVIIDLHWSDMGKWGKNIGQHKMPDENSALFWKDAAKRFANNSAVIFDIYNEPHDVTWETWKNGGVVTEKNDKGDETYRSPGMQKLVDTVRETGARNVIAAGGLDWAFDLIGVINGYALTDPKGSGIIYSTHIYPWKGGIERWDSKVTVAAGKYPILIGEVGCQPDPKQEDPAIWAPKVLAYIEKHRFNWTAWCFHPSASPCMLKDWSYAPTLYWGRPVKQALTGNQ